MIRVLLLFCSLMLYGHCHAQSIERQVISSDGDYVTNEIIQNLPFRLAYTVGEVATETLVGSTFKLTQGFHQPRLIVVSVKDLFPELSIKVFPNPTVEQVNIRVSEDLGLLQYQLFDLKGQAVSPIQKMDGLDQRLDMKAYPVGQYFLYIQGLESAKHKTFKIIKTQ